MAVADGGVVLDGERHAHYLCSVSELLQQVQQILGQRGETVACAESLTGGQVAVAFSETPGSSGTFLGGVVSYATEVKRKVLGVTAERVITSACAEQMAVGVRDLLDATWGVSTTGVAGPDEQEGQPVGTVFIGVAGPSGVRTEQLALDGDRAEIRVATVLEAIRVLHEEVS